MDPEFYKMRNCMLKPIPELFIAAKKLGEAADAHLNGDEKLAKNLLIESNLAELFRWSETLFGGKSISKIERDRCYRWRFDPERPSDVAEIASPYISMKIKKAVINRDGFFCRFCRVPVIYQPSWKVLEDHYPEETKKLFSRNHERHYGQQALDLDFDHIVPRSLGGQNTEENLVVSCAPCNCGRGNWTLSEVGIIDPRGEEIDVEKGYENWDGLTRLISFKL